MIKVYLLLFTTFLLNSCNSQTGGSTKTNGLHSLPDNSQKENGIVYFSFDDGASWVNSSNGLPGKTRIGLDGIATSALSLGVATKDNGVYLYNFKTKLWETVSTDTEIIEANIGALAIDDDDIIYVGTQHKGVFYTNDRGKNWGTINTGINYLTIRRFCVFNQILHVCTNDGFYSLDKKSTNWKLEFGQKSLQTNGATLYNGRFYLATNRGIFSQLPDKSWINSSPQFSLHNITSDGKQLYAMTYNELLLSSKDGKIWQSSQNGLPKELYTFNVLSHKNILLAGQWDGIYKKNYGDPFWKLSNTGLPSNFAVTNLKAFESILVISSSERK